MQDHRVEPDRQDRRETGPMRPQGERPQGERPVRPQGDRPIRTQQADRQGERRPRNEENNRQNQNGRTNHNRMPIITKTNRGNTEVGQNRQKRILVRD